MIGEFKMAAGDVCNIGVGGRLCKYMYTSTEFNRELVRFVVSCEKKEQIVEYVDVLEPLNVFETWCING